MSKLPVVPLETAVVEVGGTSVEVRRLSRTEALQVTTKYTKETADAAEAFIVSCGVGVTLEEATAWLASTPLEAAGVVIDKILELSNMLPQAPRKDGTVPDPKSDGSELS